MNRGRVKIQHSMQGVFVFVLLGLFAVMSTLMVLLGAQMYRGTVDRAAENNDYRVLSAYVRSMVRAEDGAGTVAVEVFNAFGEPGAVEEDMDAGDDAELLDGGDGIGIDPGAWGAGDDTGMTWVRRDGEVPDDAVSSITAVALYEDIDDEPYVTWLYHYEGEVWEQFTGADEEFEPEDGTAICPANSFDAVVRDGMVVITMTDANDEPCQVQVALRCAA